jgi:hypothetical protein
MERMKSTGGHPVAHAASGTPIAFEERLTQAKRDARKFRRDGPRFSAKMSAFLAAIRVMPLVKRAAQAAGVHRSSHYRKLKSCFAYAEAFQEAQMIGIDAIWDLAVERAMCGWEEPLVCRGRISLRKDPATGAMNSYYGAQVRQPPADVPPGTLSFSFCPRVALRGIEPQPGRTTAGRPPACG